LTDIDQRTILGGVPKLLPVIDPAANPVGCCAPLTQAPLSAEQARDLAGRLKALADPARLRLLSLLLASHNFEACTCDLTGPLGLSQPTVSHHLKKLHDAGLVTADRRGVWTYYRAVPDTLSALADALAPGPLPGRKEEFAES
jgi:ArsR family transcriptional regulator, arsenate/arsenite/antimonite-responsive transcriptional repressor